MTAGIRNNREYDVVIVGAGHAGCEAALACARLGLAAAVFTTSLEGVALMPCNPNIGGTSKGHLVREVDALGGEMGKNIDKTFIQSKMLNRSKGPAVHSLRAQADKAAYSAEMCRVLEETPGISLFEEEITEIITEPAGPNDAGGAETVAAEDVIGGTTAAAGGEETMAAEDVTGGTTAVAGGAETMAAETAKKAECLVCRGVRTASGEEIAAKAVVLCTGVYLNSRCLTGEDVRETGPSGLAGARGGLTESLREAGVRMARFKTGTPARIYRDSIDFSRLQEEKGDERIVPFSFSTDPDSVQIEQISCYLTHTTPETHEIIRKNLDRAPMFTGVIEGTGPRYCPSIEDKVVRFADREGHQVFLEPEGRDSDEIYVDGMSSSLPADVQEAMYRTVPGLENARIARYAYAIEYDCIDPTQLSASLEFKEIPGLFAGGQFNGSSGYEEAAAQGLVAGINAAMRVLGREPLVLDRSEAYIGVLIDDLVTQGTTEPYRMMTSRAEYRLLLRQDNADLRLRGHGYRVGLVSEAEYRRTEEKKRRISEEIARVSAAIVRPEPSVNELLVAAGTAPLSTGCTMAELIRRPELTYEALSPIDPDRPALDDAVREQVNIHIKYEGYIERQERQVNQFRRQEAQRIPGDIDYEEVPNLRTEARQKLARIRPASIGQAARISGVSPADVAVLLVYLKKQNG